MGTGNPFVDMFDINRDGEFGFAEQYLAFSVIEESIREEERKRHAWRDKYFYDFNTGIDPEDYDTEGEYREALYEAKYGWRDFCEDGSEYGISPYNYETEEEYEEALNEAKYGWREEYEDDLGDSLEYGVFPWNYETEEEYLEALHEEKYGWRDTCEDGYEYDLDPDLYETEEEYEEALLEAMAAREEEERYGWRKYCDDGSAYGIDPNAYETEEEYDDALETAKYAWRDQCDYDADYDVDPYDYETKEEFEQVVAEMRVKYKWRRIYEDVGFMYGVDTDDYESEEEFKRELEKAKAEALAEEDTYEDTDIRKSDYPNKRKYDAAVYLYELQHGIAFLSSDENEADEIEKCEFILNSNTIAAQYLTIYDGFLYGQAIKDNFTLPNVIDVPDEDEEPRTSVYRLIEDLSYEDETLAMKVWVWCVKEFAPYRKYMDHKEELSDYILCSIDDFSPEFMELTVKELANNETFCKAVLHENEEFIDVSEYVIYALNEGWINEAINIFQLAIASPMVKSKELDEFISTIVYNTNEYAMGTVKEQILPLVADIQDSRVRRHYAEYEEYVNDYVEQTEEDAYFYDGYSAFYETTELDKVEEPQMMQIEAANIVPEEKLSSNNNEAVYTFCGVQFYPGCKVYAYRVEDITISIGDKVLVPVGNEGKESEAEVVSIGQYTRNAAPYPVDQAKFIKRKV